MKFKRARSKEQKEIRTEQIIHAAIKLYEDAAYDKISLASLASGLSFSRENLYKYFRTKEDIFLKVIEHDFSQWVSQISSAFSKKMPLNDFASVYARILYGNKRLLELFSILTSTIERNSTLKALVEFKKSMSIQTSSVYAVLSIQFPSMDRQTLSRLLSMIMHYAVGLYPTTNSTPIQDESLRIADTGYVKPDFIRDYRDFIVCVVNGLNRKSG